uniref:Uncharacterized protein n=1 Tax=Fagus sylvatica TaxID=28930 RepID=A0A2N9FET6_FAGSY
MRAGAENSRECRRNRESRERRRRERVVDESRRRELRERVSPERERGESSVDLISSCSVGSGASSSGSRENGKSRSEIGLTERLTNILVDEGDRDLLLQRSDHEDRVMQWLQALDMQVMGACRVDERLKPLLKMNASNGVAEDRLLVHLSQEIGMVATEALHGFTNLAFWSELHGLAALQWSICQDSLNSERTRVLLTSSVHLKHNDFSKHTRNLSPASRAILLSGPAELYQQMLAKALAHYFESKLLLLDVNDFSLKMQSKYGCAKKESVSFSAVY